MGLPENLRKALDERRLNDKQASLAAGLSATWARDVMQRGVNPTTRTLRRMAAVLGVTPDALLSGEAIPPPKIRGRFVDDPEMISWLQLGEALSIEQRSRAALMVRTAFPPPSEKAS